VKTRFEITPNHFLIIIFIIIILRSPLFKEINKFRFVKLLLDANLQRYDIPHHIDSSGNNIH